MEERFKNCTSIRIILTQKVAPKPLDQEDIQYMEDYSQRQVDRINAVSDQENEAALVLFVKIVF